MKLYKFLPLIFILVFACSKEEVKEEEKVNTNPNIIEIKSNSPMLKEIKSEYPKEKYLQEEIKVTGIIKNYENSISNILSPVSGNIVFENIEIGKFVKKGDLIAKIQNNEVVQIYSNYIHEFHNNEMLINQGSIKVKFAKKNFEREKKLFDEGISPKKDYLQAENEYLLLDEELKGLKEHNIHIRNEAEALLKTYNVKLPKNDEEIISSTVEIRANNSGLITKKNILLGSNISISDIICEITDNTKLYAQLNINSDDIKKIHLNDLVKVYVNSKVLISKIDYIEPSINKDEQVFIARASINSSNLKSNLFINAVIKPKISDNKYLFLDNNCISNIEDSYFIFLDKGNNIFEKKSINIKEHINNGYYINSGIKKDEKIVCNGNFHLKSELLKSSLEEDE